MIAPSTGDVLLPTGCTACYPIKPGEPYTQSMWVKILEPFIVPENPEDTYARLFFKCELTGRALDNATMKVT